MALELRYDESVAGAKIIATKDGAQVFDGILGHGTVYPVKKDSFSILTGYAYYDGKWELYWQTTTGLCVYINTYDGTENDWEIIKNFQSIPTIGQSQAQALVNKIIKNNETILRGNLLCARYASRFSEQQQTQIRDLQNRLTARNNALQAGGLTQNIRTGYPAEYAELSGYLDALMQGNAIGIATWVVVVIAATVIAATATAAYFAYKSLADESERDVKYSQELTQALVSKLTPEEYQQLLDETKGMLTKTKIKSLVSGGFGSLKWVAIAAGAYAIYKVIKQNL